ncbi:hypothetical protein D3C85_876130 [compost metagenome]
MADGHALCGLGAAGASPARPRLLPGRGRGRDLDLRLCRPARAAGQRQCRGRGLAPAIRGRLPGRTRAHRLDGTQDRRPPRNRNRHHPGCADARSPRCAGRQHPVARHAGAARLHRRRPRAGLLGPAPVAFTHSARGARTGRAQRLRSASHRRPGARRVGQSGAFAGRLHGAPVGKPGHPASLHRRGRAPTAHAAGRAARADGGCAGRGRPRRAAPQPAGRATQRRKAVAAGQPVAQRRQRHPSQQRQAVPPRRPGRAAASGGLRHGAAGRSPTRRPPAPAGYG